MKHRGEMIKAENVGKKTLSIGWMPRILILHISEFAQIYTLHFPS